jgi:hypothetical protein
MASARDPYHRDPRSKARRHRHPPSRKIAATLSKRGRRNGTGCQVFAQTAPLRHAFVPAQFRACSNEVAELELRVAALEKKQSPSEKKVGYERWQELRALRESRGILTEEDERECGKLEIQVGEVGERIRAELARENEACVREWRASGGKIK